MATAQGQYRDIWGEEQYFVSSKLDACKKGGGVLKQDPLLIGCDS